MIGDEIAFWSAFYPAWLARTPRYPLDTAEEHLLYLKHNIAQMRWTVEDQIAPVIEDLAAEWRRIMEPLLP